MRNLFRAAALAALLMVGSCNSGSDYTPTPIEFGNSIYGNVNEQNTTISMDPALVALRFNILWETALQQNLPLDQAYYTTRETNESNQTEIVRHYIQREFFGENSVTQGTMSATIVFSGGQYDAVKDRNRAGTITIDHNGKTLSQLTAGEQWSLGFSSSGESYYRVGSNTQSPETVSRFESYVIAATQANTNTWEIRGTSTAQYESGGYVGQAAEWNFRFTIEKSSGADMTYLSAMNAEFRLSGSASGRPINSASAFDYVIDSRSPLVLRLGCNPEFKFGGVENITIRNMEAFDPTLAVSDFVWVRNEPRTTDCGYIRHINYGGEQYSFTLGDDTEIKTIYQ